MIPVNRGGVDTAATKAAIRMLQDGEMVGMFPEGRINMSDDFMLPVRPGAILIAQKAQVPIIPCLIEGSPYRDSAWSPLFMRARVRVHFGKKVGPPPAEGADESAVRDTMLHVVRELASMAGVAHFEPTLAGRNWKPSQQELEEALEQNRRRVDEQGESPD